MTQKPALVMDIDRQKEFFIALTNAGWTVTENFCKAAEELCLKHGPDDRERQVIEIGPLELGFRDRTTYGNVIIAALQNGHECLSLAASLIQLIRRSMYFQLETHFWFPLRESRSGKIATLWVNQARDKTTNGTNFTPEIMYRDRSENFPPRIGLVFAR